MNATLRNSGIPIIGNVPWGTHFCQFYQTKQDLIDILVPYFKTGLENNEFCMWITSEPLQVEEAKQALAAVVNDIDAYIKKGQLLMLDYSQWYTKSGKFNADNVLEGWVNKLNTALHQGFDGLRLTGNTFWLEKKDWTDFYEYNSTLDKIIIKYQMLALCTYPLDKYGVHEIIDIVVNHQFALIKKAGNWKLIESSERKQFEAKMSYLASFPERNPNPIMEVDLDGAIRYMNPAILHLFSDLRERGLAHPWLTDLESVMFPFSKGKTNFSIRDITIQDHSYQQAFYFSEQDRFIRIYGFDITRRKRAEAALQIQAEQYASILATTTDGLWLFNNEGKLLDVNEAYCRMSGYSHKELLNLSISDLEVIEKPEETAQHIQKVKQFGFDRFESKHRAKNGRIYEVEISTSYLQTKDQWLAFIRNITERKTAEDALRSSMERLCLALDAANSGTWEWNLLTNENIWSDELWKLYGLEPHSCKPSYEAWLKTIHPKDRTKTEHAVQEAASKGIQLNTEWRVRYRDGSERWLLSRGQPLRDINDQVVRFIGIVLDITERKVAEEILKRDKETLAKMVNQQAEELMRTHEELDQAKRLSDIGTLAATVAHELRNPLAVIRTAAYNIRRKVGNPIIENNLANVEKKVIESNQIITNLLFYSRLKLPKLEPINIYDLLNENIDSVKEQYQDSNVKIIKQLNLIKRLVINVDPIQMGELFNNIINNAYQAFPDKIGKITVHGSKNKDDMVVIQVQDNGIGIASDDLSRIFDPFFTTKAKGTGLGLTICQQLVNLHGGKIDITSTKGKGTMVTIALPMKN
jgi:PAS domain S-box-containing protein